MSPWSVFLPVTAIALAFPAATCAGSPVVSTLDTVSIHVDSVATYNALLRLWSEDLQWPVMYGKPLTGDQKSRRNYAGIWAGNVRLEICGPYPREFQTNDSPTRLHGLTFLPHESADTSALELDRREILHRPPVTWGSPESPLRFVIFEDTAMKTPHFSTSIMEIVNPDSEKSGRDRVRKTMEENKGGRLGLERVREVRITYPDDAALRKWQRFLQTDGEAWPGGAGPNLRFLKGSSSGIAAIVLEVRSLQTCARGLQELGLKAVAAPDLLECSMSGVRLLFTE